MQAIHAAIGRLGVPENALVLEPGCGIGNFMSHAPAAMRFVGVELDSISGRIAKRGTPARTSGWRISATASCPRSTPLSATCRSPT